MFTQISILAPIDGLETLWSSGSFLLPLVPKYQVFSDSLVGLNKVVRSPARGEKKQPLCESEYKPSALPVSVCLLFQAQSFIKSEVCPDQTQRQRGQKRQEEVVGGREKRGREDFT